MKKILLFVFCFILFAGVYAQTTPEEIKNSIDSVLKKHRLKRKTKFTKSVLKPLERRRNIRFLVHDYRATFRRKLFVGKSKERTKDIERKTIKDNGKMYYYLEGLNYLYKGKVTESDSAIAMTYIRAAYFVDSLGYEFEQDEIIEAVWNVAGRESISEEYLDSVSLAPLEKDLDTLIKYHGESILNDFKRKLTVVDEKIRKWKEKIAENEEEIRRNNRKILEFERKKNAIHRIRLNKDKIREKSMAEIDRLAKELEGGRMGDLSDVATVGYKEIGRGVKYANIGVPEIDGYVIAEYCDQKTTKIAEAIIMSILLNGKSDSIKIIFNIKGMSDGQGYGKKIKPYSGDLDDIIDEFYRYLQRRDENAGDTIISFSRGDIFTNLELAFLRAYCFKYQMKKKIAAKGGSSLNIDDEYNIDAVENYEEGDKYRGIDIDAQIEGLFSHYTDSIAFLEEEEERLIKEIETTKDSIDKAIVKRKKLQVYIDDAMYLTGGKVLQLLEEIDMMATRKTLKKIIKKEKEDHKYGIRKIHLVMCFTNDGLFKDISDTISKTLIKMYENYTADNDNIVLNKKIYINSLYKKEYIAGIIKRLRVQKNDIIIFYYFGHGYRLPKQNKWPNLLIGSLDDDAKESGIEMKFVKKLLRKNNNLKQIIIESCNAHKDSFPLTLPVFEENEFLHPSSGVNKSNFNDLYMNYKGHMITSSCSPHEWSFTNDSTWGYFGEIFYNELEFQCGYDIRKNPDWKDMLANTKETTLKYLDDSKGKQTPQYEIKIISMSKFLRRVFGLLFVKKEKG